MSDLYAHDAIRQLERWSDLLDDLTLLQCLDLLAIQVLRGADHRVGSRDLPLLGEEVPRSLGRRWSRGSNWMLWRRCVLGVVPVVRMVPGRWRVMSWRWVPWWRTSRWRTMGRGPVRWRGSRFALPLRCTRGCCWGRLCSEGPPRVQGRLLAAGRWLRRILSRGLRFGTVLVMVRIAQELDVGRQHGLPRGLLTLISSAPRSAPLSTSAALPFGSSAGGSYNSATTRFVPASFAISSLPVLSARALFFCSRCTLSRVIHSPEQMRLALGVGVMGCEVMDMGPNGVPRVLGELLAEPIREGLALLLQKSLKLGLDLIWRPAGLEHDGDVLGEHGKFSIATDQRP